MNIKTYQRDQSIGAQMYLAVTILKRKTSDAIKAAGAIVTLEQLAILGVLTNSEEPMNMSQLSREVFKVNANVTRIVDKLEKKGLAKRVAGLSDRRSFKIYVTEEGRNEYKRMEPILLNNLKDCTKTITPDERKELLRIVKKIIAENSKK
jgi:DNA-binding MarR family transcriptional regulator